MISRGAEADFRIDHASVSRRHVKLEIGEPVRVIDLGSSNGTWVDGKRLDREASVVARTGALIEVDAVLLVLQSAPIHPAGGAARSEGASPPGVVISDPAMLRVHELLSVAARSSLVILLGETGSGKEVLATRVHTLSPRAGKPFLKVNCGAFVETLLDAELFRHERGAFTGAVAAKAGLLESANGGTLVLDELGELPLPTQVKLLRVLESREVTRVGAMKPRRSASVRRCDEREPSVPHRGGDVSARPLLPPRRRIDPDPRAPRTRLGDPSARPRFPRGALQGRARTSRALGGCQAVLVNYAWPGSLPSTSRRHEYKLLVNGESYWRTDDHNPLTTSDGLGSHNSVLFCD